MFQEIRALRPFRGAVELLAERDVLAAAVRRGRLAANDVPVAARRLLRRHVRRLGPATGHRLPGGATRRPGHQRVRARRHRRANAVFSPRVL
ncbi:hypothetical protein [Nonomuraea rubra]|uniref:hypothetical protein n=1 Tax=Nonomuraea rubra TaxID=46180 RepID=UPI0031ECD316